MNSTQTEKYPALEAGEHTVECYYVSLEASPLNDAPQLALSYRDADGKTIRQWLKLDVSGMSEKQANYMGIQIKNVIQSPPGEIQIEVSEREFNGSTRKQVFVKNPPDTGASRLKAAFTADEDITFD